MTSFSTGAIFCCASLSVAALVVIRRRTLPWPASGATVGSVASRNSWTFAASPDQGLQRRLEHALHLRWHPWERGEEGPLPLHERPHRRPNRVGDELRSLGEEGLLVVVGRRLAAKFCEHRVHVFASLLVLDHLAARQGRDAGVGKVVRGRAEPSRRYDQVGSGGGLAQGGDDPLRIVPDGGVAVDNHPERGETLADPDRVRINEVA